MEDEFELTTRRMIEMKETYCNIGKDKGNPKQPIEHLLETEICKLKLRQTFFFNKIHFQVH